MQQDFYGLDVIQPTASKRRRKSKTAQQKLTDNTVNQNEVCMSNVLQASMVSDLMQCSSDQRALRHSKTT